MGAVVHRQVAENKFSCFLVEAEMALVVASREECGREDDIVVGMAAESGNLGRGRAMFGCCFGDGRRFVQQLRCWG